MKNKHRDVFYFLERFLLISIVPIGLIVLLYIIEDPYSVIREEPIGSFDYSRGSEPRLSFNKSMLSVNALKKRLIDGDIPDSFIFGSSISCYYEVDYWNKYINSSTTPFHFDSSMEGAASLLLKIKYLKHQNIEIKNALIIIDVIALTHPISGNSIMTMDYPELSSSVDWIKWHYSFFSSSIDLNFLVNYLPSKFTNKISHKNHTSIFESQPICYDCYRNEESLPMWNLIAELRPEIYFTSAPGLKPTYYIGNDCMVIDNKRESLFRAIAKELEGVNYHIVATPTRDKLTLSEQDHLLLDSIFSTDRFHDYTQSMSYVADDAVNWYDRRHYRANVARLVMDDVYNK